MYGIRRDRHKRGMTSDESIRRDECADEIVLQNNQYLHCTYVNKRVLFLNGVLSFANHQLIRM